MHRDGVASKGPLWEIFFDALPDVVTPGTTIDAPKTFLEKIGIF